MDLCLVQPRHVYAPDPSIRRIGHVYMPTSLLTAASRLLQAGVRLQVVDENVFECEILADVVAINLIGAPYIRKGVEFSRRLERWNPKGKLILGGQVVSGFREEEFRKLFGSSAVNGNDDRQLAIALGINSSALPPPESVSLIGAYELLKDNVMQLYLSNEFGFYLSQGCQYTCSFCAAKRTRCDPNTGKMIPVKEVYRDIITVEKDLRYLVKKSLRYGLNEMKIYLSNLDLFQTPRDLRRFAAVVQSIRRDFPDFTIKMRGLSNVNSFLKVRENDPDLIHDLASAGLKRIGFGVDGATEDIWRAVRKPHGSYSCIDAISVSVEYGLTPETLMVFGHEGVDNEESLQLACDLVKAMWDKYGSLPRPHVSKSVIPGNDGWYDPNKRHLIDIFLGNPELFQVLDFTALPSVLTHLEPAFRDMVKRHYLQVCKMSGTVTQYVLPEEPGLTTDELMRVRSFNEERYDV